MLPDGLSFPSLPPPYGEALRACVADVFRRYDVLAVVASGTIVRGAPDPRSDLDIHVLHREPFRERIQVRHEGVACEIFVNPPSRIPAYFEEDRQARRPISAHMFATGVIVYDPTGIASDLADEAHALLAAPPALESAALLSERYSAATLFEDADDLAGRDPGGAALLLGAAVRTLAECRIVAEPGWLPRPKDLLLRLREVDPEAARLAEEAVASGDLTERLSAGRRLCVRVTGSEGFFEWDGEREPIAP